MAFASLSFLELIHSLNIRSEESIFKIGIFKNMYLTFAILIGILMQIAVIAIPNVAKVFRVVPLYYKQWIYIIVVSLLPIVIMEFQKKISKTDIENKSFSCKNWKHNV